MVAIVTGQGLGLNSGSFAALGQRGVFGSATVGRSGDQAYVNAATGNLVLQTRDEFLSGIGLSTESRRTYNSRGQFTDDNGDNWTMGLYDRQLQLSGTFGQPGSSLVRTDRDGSQALLLWDSALQRYVGKEGGGAYDQVTAAGADWVWTDGATGLKETYNSYSGRLTTSTDRDGNTVHYSYTPVGLLYRVEQDNGDRTEYVYSGRLLQEIRTVFASGGASQSVTRVRYEYDGSRRLSSVAVDLSPEDNSVADGNVFVTAYTYQGDSKLVASIRHNGDIVLRVVYDAQDRVQSVFDAMGQRTDYRYDTAARRTTAVDAGGGETVFDYLATGELSTVSCRSGSTVLQSVTYAYNPNGDVIGVIDGLGRRTDYGYDARGNQTRQRDAFGNTVVRTYSALNLVQTEAVFAEPNPANTGDFSTDVRYTTRYVYDDAGLGRLRFVLSQEGRVVEYRYDAQGQRTASLIYSGVAAPVRGMVRSMSPRESTMAHWVDVNQSQLSAERVDLRYDGRGQLARTIAYSRTSPGSFEGIADGDESITVFVYDQAGQLLQSTSPTGGIRTNVYDGMGRVIARTDPAQTVFTTYVDAGNRVEQTQANGLKTIQVFDAAGRLLSVQQVNTQTQSLGITRYAYDADNRLVMTTDPTGVRHWMLYDAAGRKTADVDGNGSLTEYSYNRNGALTRSTAYATAVDTARLVDASGRPLNPSIDAVRPASSSADVSQWFSYDLAGRLAKTVSADGAVTETGYDTLSHVVQVTAYATRISTTALGAQPDPAEISPVRDASADRTARRFYDNDGALVGELDAEGFLTEHRYDAAGRRVWTLRYSLAVSLPSRSAGTMAQLLATLGPSPDRVSTVFFFNGRGQKVAEVDAENFLTEFEYDKNGFLHKQVRYQPALTTAVTSASSLATLKAQWAMAVASPGAPQEQQVTLWVHDEFGRITRSIEADGTISENHFDAQGNLVRSTRAAGQGAEERSTNARYDLQGRLVAELSAADAWRLTEGMSVAEADAVFDRYGVQHAYDASGRRISTTDRNKLTTLFFYDEDGQLNHIVNAMGEVTERRYNTLGQLQSTVDYGTRLASAMLGRLQAGLSRVADAVATIAQTAADGAARYAYSLTGRVSRTELTLGTGRVSVTDMRYDAFGDETWRQTWLGGGSGRVRVDSAAFDRRGLQTRRTLDAEGLAIDTAWIYDAFGRCVKVTDDAGNTSEVGYDRLGRQIATVDRLSNRTQTRYDAFGRVLSQTDALGKTTRFAYDTASRSVVMTTPENIRVTTVSNRHGQTVSITDGRQFTTHFTYDREGQLTQTSTPLPGTGTSQTFDRGRLAASVDANGVRTVYTYDDANRVLTREVDPGGLGLQTHFAYDARGRQISVTDPNGIITRVEYDLAGRVLTQTVDEGVGRLNLRTVYTHDDAGHVLSVASPGGKVTQYTYDALGRRVQELVDPAGLKLLTRFSYDHQDRLQTRTDAEGAVTRYVYDAQGQLRFTVDGEGGVSEQRFDATGRVTRRIRYAKALSDRATLPAAPDLDEMARRLAASPGQDAIEANCYDGDGRLRYTVDGTGAVVEFRYDDSGNIVERIAYARVIDLSTWAEGNVPAVVASPGDVRVRSAYDALGRLTAQSDATGAVTRREYDKNGNLLRLTRHATRLAAGQTIDQAVASAPGDLVCTVRIVVDRRPYATVERTVTRTQVFTADQADAGVDFSWADPDETLLAGSISAARRLSCKRPWRRLSSAWTTAGAIWSGRRHCPEPAPAFLRERLMERTSSKPQSSAATRR